MKRIILILILLPSIAQAFDQWDKQDKILFAMSSTAMVVDWRQTRAGLERPNDFEERNPLLGTNPSKDKVDGFFALSLVTQAAIAYVLPSKWRKIYLTGMTVLSVTCVANNLGLGVGIQW